MKRPLIFILLLLLTACSFSFTVDVPIEFPDFNIPTQTETVTGVTPSPTQTATGTPTNTATATLVAPTITVTVESTPTREIIGNVIRVQFRTNIREAPDGTVRRVSNVGEEFTVFAQRDGWLNVANTNGSGWLFNGSWVTFISGSLGEVPASQAQAQSRIGYNTLEVYDEEYYINHAKAICPAFMLVMDNLGLADRLEKALRDDCGTRVIHRNWYASDGEEFLERSPRQTVDRWIGEGYPNLIRYTTNEVSCGQATPCSRYVSHEVEVARLAREAGFTVVLGNTGVGKFSPNDVIAGIYNPLVQAANDYDHLLGFHEYTWGSLSFGFGRIPKEDLLEPFLMQPERWSRDVQFAFAPFSSQVATLREPYGNEAMRLWFSANPLDDGAFFAQAYDASNCGELPSYWHMARSFWILLWYQCSTGIQELPLIVHTEWGWDYMADINSVIEPLRNQFAHPQYEYNLRGWRSLEFLWAYWWTDWSIAEAAFYQMDYAIDLYPQNHYFLLFAWSDDRNRDWTRAGFSFGNYGDNATIELHQLIESKYDG